MLKAVTNPGKHDALTGGDSKDTYMLQNTGLQVTRRLKKDQYGLPKFKMKLIISINVCVHYFLRSKFSS